MAAGPGRAGRRPAERPTQRRWAAASLLLPRDLPLGEWRPHAADLHVQAIGHAGGEGALDGGANLIEAIDGFTAAAEPLHDDVVGCGLQLESYGGAAGSERLQLAFQAPARVVAHNHDD